MIKYWRKSKDKIERLERRIALMDSEIKHKNIKINTLIYGLDQIAAQKSSIQNSGTLSDVMADIAKKTIEQTKS